MFLGQMKPQPEHPPEVLERVVVIPPGYISQVEETPKKPYGYQGVEPKKPTSCLPGTLANEVSTWVARQQRPVVRADCVAELGDRRASQLHMLSRRGHIQSRTFTMPEARGQITEYLALGIQWPRLPDGAKLARVSNEYCNDV